MPNYLALVGPVTSINQYYLTYGSANEPAECFERACKSLNLLCIVELHDPYY